MKLNVMIMVLLLCKFSFSVASDVVVYTENCKKALLFGKSLTSSVEGAIKYFSLAALDLPLYLSFAHHQNIPFIFFCPEHYSHISPVDDQAYIIEGARTALAWMSAFYRFKKVNFLVIRVPNLITIDEGMYQKYFESALDYLSSLKNSDDIHARIIPLELLEKKNSYGTFESIVLDKKSEHQYSTIKNFNKRTYIITGGAGFLGSYLAESLLNMGYHVVVLDNLVCANHKNLELLEKYELFEFINIDINKPIKINGKIDVIVHLASIPSPVYYYKMPFETLPCGLIGTKNLLEIARSNNATFIFASSSEVYGDPEQNPQSEDYVGNVNPLGMRSQYDQSKRGGETLCKWYFENYGVDVRILRIFNTYGPRMNLNDGRVITNFIYSLLNKQPLTIHGSGTQTRSFSFVADTINGILKIMQAEFLPTQNIQDRIFNVGNDQEYTINQVALLAQEIGKKHLGYEPSINYVHQIDPTDPKVRKPDLTKIKKRGYQYEISLNQGFEMTFFDFYHINRKE